MTPSSAALLRPHLTMHLFAVETDKPSKTHRCSGRSRLTTQESFPDTGPSAGCCLPIEKQQSIGHGMKCRSGADWAVRDWLLLGALGGSKPEPGWRRVSGSSRHESSPGGQWSGRSL
jgi:hypothetical protein